MLAVGVGRRLSGLGDPLLPHTEDWYHAGRPRRAVAQIVGVETVPARRRRELSPLVEFLARVSLLGERDLDEVEIVD